MCLEGEAAVVQPSGSAFRVIAPGGRSIDVTVRPVDARGFDDGLFAAERIECPEWLRSAIPTRRATFLAGRQAARDALHRLGIDDTRVAVGDQREPIWPRDIVGSISHSSTHAVAVVAPLTEWAGLGIDIERVGTTLLDPAVHHRIVSPTEVALLERAGGALAAVTPPGVDSSNMPRVHVLTAAFSAKESFYKAAFPLCRSFFDFDAVVVTGADLHEGVIELTLAHALHDALPAGRRLRVRVTTHDSMPDHVMTLCAVPVT